MGFLYTQRHNSSQQAKGFKPKKPLKEVYSTEELAPFVELSAKPLADFIPPDSARKIKLTKYLITKELSLVRLRLADARRFRLPENLAAEQARLSSIIKQIKLRLLQIEQINANADEILEINEAALTEGQEKLVKCWEAEAKLGIKVPQLTRSKGKTRSKKGSAAGGWSNENADADLRLQAVKRRQQEQVLKLMLKGMSKEEAEELVGLT